MHRLQGLQSKGCSACNEKAAVLANISLLLLLLLARPWALLCGQPVTAGAVKAHRCTATNPPANCVSKAHCQVLCHVSQQQRQRDQRQEVLIRQQQQQMRQQ
jgi:hypothetical protein